MKVNKYDRQIRLWGAEGQRRLGEARVALLGCSGAGIQALKNLVLPGVGHIDIWDDKILSLQDLSSSFFFSPEDIGKPAAVAASANLLEMNPDVSGLAFVRDPLDLFHQSSRQQLRKYDLIVGGDLDLSRQMVVSRVCWQQGIPVVFVAVVGFYVYVRNQKRVHTVEFQRTAGKKYYLRLHDPFPELVEYSKQWDIIELTKRLKEVKDSLDRFRAEESEQKQVLQKQKNWLLKKLEQIPYPIILLQLYKYLPKASRTKASMVEQLKEWGMLLGEGYRDNFIQAGTRTFDLFQDADNFLRGLDRFQSDFVKNADKTAEPALIFLRACGQHLRQTGHLPQPFDLPDIETDTKTYIQLKEVYRRQHSRDIVALGQVLRGLYGQLPDSLSQKKISEFINNIESIQVMELSPYFKELQVKAEEEVDPNLRWMDNRWRHIMLAMRAWKTFKDRYGNAPTLKDLGSVTALAGELRSQFGFAKGPEGEMQEQSSAAEVKQEQRYLREVCRVQGQSTINMFSIAGAIAGQESVKLIAGCFVPVKSGFIFSGVDAVGFPVDL